MSHDQPPFTSELDIAVRFFWIVVLFAGAMLVISNAHGGCQ